MANDCVLHCMCGLEVSVERCHIIEVGSGCGTKVTLQ